MKRFLALVLLAACLPATRLFAEDAPKYGILLVSTGNGPDFNNQVTALRDQADKKAPTEVSFGLYVGVAQVMELQNGVNRLAARGVKKIVVVPLLMDSDSQDMDQLRYAFGLEDNPAETKQSAAEENPMAGAQAGSNNIATGQPIQSAFPGQSGDSGDEDHVHTSLPLVLEGALDNAPQVAAVLLARAKALSENPSHETVILLGRGASDDDMNKACLQTLEALAAAVQDKGHFKAVEAALLREDASQDAKDEASRHLLALVDGADQNGGTAILVPAMLSLGSVEKDLLSDALAGNFYAWNGKTLIPDPELGKWVLAQGADGAKQADVRKYK